MPHYGFVSDQSRKAKAARNLYDYLKQKLKPEQWENPPDWEIVQGFEGIRVPQQEKHRVLNIRLHDEHMSPYFKTDMNLFHMLMLDDTAEVVVYRADHGWLFAFEGIPESPKPFGQLGFDTR